MQKTFVTINTSYEGIHCFPEAPDEVKFLRQEHRHTFGVTAKVEVYSDDREIEFIMMKHRINDWLMRQLDENGVWYMGRMSCEQVASKILNVLSENYNMFGRQYEITVDEDGENGATIAGVYGKDGKSTNEDITMDQYQKKSYVAIQAHIDNKEEVMHWAIGLGEEAGEALSIIKHRYYGGDYDVMDLVGELGDVLWYVAALCTACEINLGDVAAYNLAKLEHRFPDRVFSDTLSKARHTSDVAFKDTEAYCILEKRITKNIESKGKINNEKI